MTNPLKTAILAAAVCATSLVCMPMANADEFYQYYPDYDLYRLPNGSMAVDPGDVSRNYQAAPTYNYGMTAPSYNYAPRRYYRMAPPPEVNTGPAYPWW